MKAFFRAFFASLLAIIVVIAIVVGVIASKASEKPKIKDHTWLVVDIYGALLEYDPPSDPMSEIMGGKPETLQRILSNLEKAAVDERIEGVIMKLSGSNNAGFASIQEIRGAIRKVRGTEKKVYCFSDGINLWTYCLATACDSIFMPPTSYVEIKGFALISEHIRGTLDKLGIKPNLHKIKDYKSAAELVTRKNMSEAARENRRWMLDDYWEMVMQILQEDRRLSEEQVVELMQHAIFTADEAVEAGLVDRLIYSSELENMLKLEDEDNLRWISQGKYAKIEPGKLGLKGKKKIAIVHAQGMIGGRRNKIDPFFGVMMGHESIVSQLRKARKDDDVAAVIFRVDSPGGEGLASDLIGYEVKVVADTKPIVASMVDVAGSGGYMVSYRATKIVAGPATITGSIGSISGKFNMKGLYDKLGLTMDWITKGPMALIWTDYRDFTDEEKARFEDNHWDGFNAWLADVAKYRGMTFDEAEKLAHGRVFTGRQGIENGLVDEIGGLDRAIELAKELAEIPADEKVTVVHYPKKKGFLEAILSGGDLTAVARQIVYRFIHEDLADTWRMITERHLYMMDGATIE
ncbi:MAG: signal peptide peptidase SppA [bacterium]|nr:MAG: signal peptide peptidase SppA [bacterium]